ncbi:MAG TPA: prepilin-type N-terminal cleavage/methylation domain-containing protein [Burkholderiales bacterium]|nr:prepilin-type N-terminal cleavage/methylation domain-containing protein [Burkholderiales bacterium]
MFSSRQHGLSLIEVVIFIVVLGIGIAGLAVLYNRLTLSSVDPLVRKQAVAIASSLMEEIQLRPFTFCDPDDPAVFTATGVGDCATPEGIGVEGGETRYGPTFFDNVSDYAGPPDMLGSIQDITGATVLTGYSAQVRIVAAGGDFPAAIPADEALRITITVTGPANTQVVLQGYRLRYAPNSP